MQRAERELTYSDFVHPADIAAVASLVRNATDRGALVRVRGALHSEPGSVLGDDFSRTGSVREVVNLMLDKLTHVAIGATNAATGLTTVVAQAGVSLGGDGLALGRDNPQRDSARSLFDILQRHGLSLPITGGISHQTLGGFLATGSAGGSVHYSFQDAVQAIRIIKADGSDVTIARAHVDFDALLTGLGLFGVVVEVTLACAPTYDIEGLRSVQAVSDCDVKLFAPASDPASLQRFLTDKTYSRVIWWPQPGVQRVELWEAKRVAPPAPVPGPPPQSDGVLSVTLQLAARALLASVVESLLPTAGEGAQQQPGRLERALINATLPLRLLRQTAIALDDAFSPASPTHITRLEARAVWRSLRRHRRTQWQPPAIDFASENHPRQPPDLAAVGVVANALARILRTFVRTYPYAQASWVDDQNVARKYAAEHFRDPWQRGLPMDNPVHDRALPVTFTEIWIPIAHTQLAMQRMRDLFARDGFAATGTFCIELYAAKASQAWISPAYQRDVFRIDPFWFDDGDDEARQAFFSQFWDLLADLDARLHWGKALSAAGSPTGVTHREQALPKLADFRTLRASYDPQETFLTEYWKRHLGIL